jgi:cytochrome c551/c552
MRSVLIAIVLAAAAGPLAAAPVTFADRLQAKFHHERCLSCHQFNTRANNGRAYTSHRSRYQCTQCHRADLIGLPANSEWMAPDKMDYTGFSAPATCHLIRLRIGPDPDGSKLVRHLLEDGRIRWALDSGRTPAGKTPTVPGGYAEWKRDVDAWVRDGMRCD